MRRYSRSPVIKAGTAYGSQGGIDSVRSLYNSGNLQATSYVLKEGERLDHIAGKFLGDSTMWWAIAAISGIGWGLQCPPGTVVLIPNRQQLESI
jgi:hypothetical protein